MAVRHLWLVRHGEAVPDQSDLTTAGRRQAELVSERLAGVPLEAISHSPRPRAVRTAQIVARHFPDVPIREAPELDDRIPVGRTGGPQGDSHGWAPQEKRPVRGPAFPDRSGR